MNNGKLTFSDSIDKNKVVYSNKLCIWSFLVRGFFNIKQN
jgi:hypothetical protein